MNTTYLAIDVESGSLLPEKGDLLTAYFAVLDQDFKVLDELDLKLKPNDGRLPNAEESALRVNGIDLKKHVEDPNTITYSEANKKLVTLIKKYLKKTGRYSNIRAIGYNLGFDRKFIQAYILPEDEWQNLINYNEIDPKNSVNMLKDAGWLPADLGTLVSAVKYFNIPMGLAHTAKADTLATIEVYKKILELLTSKKDGGQSIDLIQMLEAE